MDRTELVDDTLEELALAAANKLVMGEAMSVNDWDALQALASFRLLEIDMEDMPLNEGTGGSM